MGEDKRLYKSIWLWLCLFLHVCMMTLGRVVPQASPCSIHQDQAIKPSNWGRRFALSSASSSRPWLVWSTTVPSASFWCRTTARTLALCQNKLLTFVQVCSVQLEGIKALGASIQIQGFLHVLPMFSSFSSLAHGWSRTRILLPVWAYRKLEYHNWPPFQEMAWAIRVSSVTASTELSISSAMCRNYPGMGPTAMSTTVDCAHERRMRTAVCESRKIV